MKNINWLLPTLALCSAASYAAPFMAVGDNAELFLTGSAAVRFDDNIFLDSNNEQNDTILSFTPGFDLVFGKGSATTGDIYYREEFRRYSTHDNQNTSLSNLGFSSRYDNGKTKMGAAASYAQVAQSDNNTRASGTIVRREVSNLNLNTEFAFSEKTSFGAALVYDKTDYSPTSFTDSSSWAIPVDMYYELSPKLAMSAGYRYRDTTLSGTARDSTENFFNIGARGEFTPKLTGQVRVGYNQRSLDGASDQTGLGLDSALTYAYSEKTSFQLTVSNDFSNSATGDNTKVRNYAVSTRSQMSEQWNFGASLGVRSVTYSNRSEDFFTGSVNVTYTYSTYLNFGASYAYSNNDSTLATASFKDTIFSFGANVRY